MFLDGGAEVTGDLSGRPRVPKVPPLLCLSCFHAINSQVHFLYTSAAVARYNCLWTLLELLQIFNLQMLLVKTKLGYQDGE